MRRFRYSSQPVALPSLRPAPIHTGVVLGDVVDPAPGSPEAWEKGKKILLFWGMVIGAMGIGFAYVVAKEGLTT